MERPSHAQLLARRLAGKPATKSISAEQKDGSGNANGSSSNGNGGGKFASPTDALMSPCTQKLRDNKGLLYKK